MPQPPKNLRDFSALTKVVEHLRGPEGCPWDKEQNHSTLTRFAIEEAFELAEAIDGGEKADIVEELGDLLLQVVLHAEIARQEGRFDVFDVIESIGDKMVRRHPHVFGDVKVSGSGEVLKNWAELKAAEKSAKTSSSSPTKPLSFDIPVGIPSLIRSQKIGEKTEKIHFDWGQPEEVLAKIEEEVAELRLALSKHKSTDFRSEAAIQQLQEIESEIGDALFSLAQLARHMKLDSEQALRKTNQRFEKRFTKMLELVSADGQDWNALSPNEREKFWQKAKSSLK